MKSLFIYILLITFISCKEDYQTELENGVSRLVIIGQICDTLSRNEIKISRTIPYYADKVINNGLSGAFVEIETSEGETIFYEEDPTEKGLYNAQNAFSGKIGIQYTLKVYIDFDGDGYTETYSATSKMPPHLQLDSISFKQEKILNYHIYPLKLNGADFVEYKYLLINYLLNGIPVTLNLNEWLTFDSKLIGRKNDLDVIILVGETMTNILVDKVDEAKCSDDEPKRPIIVTSGDSITAIISQIDYIYFNYIEQCKASTKSNNPILGGNNGNMISNISGGALGSFSTRSIVKKVNVIP